MNISEIIMEVEELGSDRTKKRYLSQGAHEPLFGNSIASLKPIAKKIMKQDDVQEIAMELYQTGNYDLMYLAGMIVNPHQMTKDMFNKWLDQAYFYMISDFIVAVSLSETDIAIELANEWIQSEEELTISAGYSTYCWLIGSQPDSVFIKSELERMLEKVLQTIGNMPNRAKYAMYNFIYTVGVSYIPLHEKALEIANEIGPVSIRDKKNKSVEYNAKEDIEKAVEKGRIGFKRPYVRC